MGTDIDYVRAKKIDDDTVYIVAEALAKKVLEKKVEILGTFKGSELVGKQYKPLLVFCREKVRRGFSWILVVMSPLLTVPIGTYGTRFW